MWEKNCRKMPLQSLVKVAEHFNISRDEIYRVIDQGVITTEVNLPLTLKKIRDIIKYLNPMNHKRVNILKCSNKTLQQIKTVFNLRIHSNGYYSLMNSKDLNNYLKAFFRYTKVHKIQPPLTNEVKLWYKNGVDLKRAIICPCLQSDGSMDQQRNRLRFIGLNKILHNYFVDAMYYVYNELPTSYFKCALNRDTNDTYTAYKNKPEIVNDIIKLAGSAKTKPAVGQTVEDYLKDPQPHLIYLKNAPKIEQQITLRIWACTDGYTSIEQNSGRTRIIVGIACAHPVLAKQLKQIASKSNIHFTIKKSPEKTWSGIDKLVATSMSSILNFLKLGGFIEGVKISSNSPYHKGIDKDILLLGFLEYKKREMKSTYFRNSSIKKVHDAINKIIKNKKYKDAAFYIRYFS